MGAMCSSDGSQEERINSTDDVDVALVELDMSVRKGKFCRFIEGDNSSSRGCPAAFSGIARGELPGLLVLLGGVSG